MEAKTTWSRPPFWLLIILVVAIISILGPYISFDRSRYYDTQIILHPFDMTKHLIKDRTYAIIFDGGSTGTRIHIFTFLIDHQVKSRKIMLESEQFFYTKPGLSYYAENVTKAAESLEPLLDKAYLVVPSLLTHRTQILLRATAGLRLLPGDAAEEILDEVEGLLEQTPFKSTFVFCLSFSKVLIMCLPLSLFSNARQCFYARRLG